MSQKTRNFKLLTILIAFLTLGALAVGCGDDDEGRPSKLTFGQVPSEDAAGLETAYSTTTQILIDNVEGLEEIDMVVATEYAGIAEGVIAGRIDIAQFGPFSYVISTKNGANLDVAGALTRAKGANPGYRSYLVTGKDSGINDISDLPEKVCFVDPGSTSSFLFPSEGLLSAGLDPMEGSTNITPIFAGGHDASILSVLNGDCDAGFAADVFLKAQPGDDAPGICKVEETLTVSLTE